MHVLKAWLHLMAARVAYEGTALRLEEEVDLGQFGRYMVVALEILPGRGLMLVQDRYFREEHPDKLVEKLHEVKGLDWNSKENVGYSRLLARCRPPKKTGAALLT